MPLVGSRCTFDGDTPHLAYYTLHKFSIAITFKRNSMTTDIKPKRDIYSTRLFSRRGSWYPRRLGVAHYLYYSSEITWKHCYPVRPPFFALALDAPYLLPQWKTINGLSIIESLFARLYPLYQCHGCTFVYATMPDGGATTCVEIDEDIQNKNGLRFTPSLLDVIERIPSSQGGPRCMALFFEKINSAVVFHYHNSLSISFHGTENLQKELTTILSSDTPSNYMNIERGCIIHNPSYSNFADPVIHFHDGTRWNPSLLGQRRPLYQSHIGDKHITFLELVINPPTLAPIWPLGPKETIIPSPIIHASDTPEEHTYTSTLFNAIRSLTEKYTCCWICASTHPDQSVYMAKEKRTLTKGDPKLRSPIAMLYFAENPGHLAHKCIEETMIFHFEELGGAIVFQRNSTLEINYFGSNQLWQELHHILNIQNENS